MIYLLVYIIIGLVYEAIMFTLSRPSDIYKRAVEGPNPVYAIIAMVLVSLDGILFWPVDIARFLSR